MREISIDEQLRLHRGLLNPLLAKIEGEDVFILDGGSQTIKRFDKTGALIAEIGNGVGNGPGEVRKITDFLVRDDRIWVVDPRARTVSAFRQDGTYLSRFRTDHRPMRIGPMGDDLVLMQIGPDPSLFYQVDSTGTVLKTFGDIGDDPTGMTLYGTFGRHPHAAFTYAPALASIAYVYDEQGKRIQTIEFPDGYDLPSPQRREEDGGARVSIPEVPVETQGVGASDRGVSVYSVANHEQARETPALLDRYGADGSYNYSVALPHSFSKVHVQGTRVAGVRDTTVFVYNLD